MAESSWPSACVGCHAWWFDATLDAAWNDAHTRLYVSFAPAAAMLRVCLAYEAWNTLCAVVLPEYRTAAFVGHHATTLFLAVLCTVPFLHPYSIFFLGPPSVSSVLLGLVDIFRHCPTLAARWPTANLACRVAFALSFLLLRSLMWPLVSARFWHDVLGALRGGTAHSAWACTVYLLANVFLTALQIVWTVRIVQGLAKALGLAGGNGGDAPKGD